MKKYFFIGGTVVLGTATAFAPAFIDARYWNYCYLVCAVLLLAASIVVSFVSAHNDYEIARLCLSTCGLLLIPCIFAFALLLDSGLGIRAMAPPFLGIIYVILAGITCLEYPHKIHQFLRIITEICIVVYFTLFVYSLAVDYVASI